MKRPSSWRLAVLLLAGSVVFAASFGVGVTYAYFSSSVTSADNEVVIADSYDGTPPGDKAYNDANGNGKWDSNEATYSASDLVQFDNTSVNLVIPSDVKKVRGKNTDVSIRANTIESSAEIRAGKSVSLTATGGDVTVTNTKIRSKKGGVSISASGSVDLDSANVISQSDMTLNSDGDMVLDSASLKAKNGHITADLSTTSATLSVAGTSIDDPDDTLIYEPDVSLSGTPSSGCAKQKNGSGGVCA